MHTLKYQIHGSHGSRFIQYYSSSLDLFLFLLSNRANIYYPHFVLGSTANRSNRVLHDSKVPFVPMLHDAFAVVCPWYPPCSYLARSVGRGGPVRAGGFVDLVSTGRARPFSDIETDPSRWNIDCGHPVRGLRGRDIEFETSMLLTLANKV